MIRYQLATEASTRIAMTAWTTTLASLTSPQMDICSTACCIAVSSCPAWAAVLNDDCVTGR